MKTTMTAGICKPVVPTSLQILMLAERGWDDAEVDISSRLEVCKRRWDLQGGSLTATAVKPDARHGSARPGPPQVPCSRSVGDRPGVPAERRPPQQIVRLAGG